MDNSVLTIYKYNGARSLILLHEQHLESCLRIWKKARELGVSLPDTEDSDYQSLETLLRHILRAARGYMTWICTNLNLEDPGIEKTPEVDDIAEKADEHLQHLLEKWRIPLSGIPEEKFYSPVYKSRWGVDYCIDAMLEHAVMHPIRHEYQLNNLIREKENTPT